MRSCVLQFLRLKPAFLRYRKIKFLSYAYNLTLTQIKNCQYVAKEIVHFFEGYPVSLVVTQLIEHIFWVKNLVH